VPVLIVPYPQPIRDRTCSYSLLTQAEHQFVNRFVGQLDGTLRQAARDAGFYYLDAMEGAFGDRLRICDRPPSEIGVNFVALKTVQGVVDQVVNPANWIHNSVHPNERGHEAMAAVLEAWMRAHPDPSPTPGPADRPAPFIPSTLEDLMRPDPPSSCGAAVTEPAYCDRGDVAWAITQVGRFARAAALPMLLLVAGAWLLWLPLLAWSGPRFARLGDRLAKRLWRLLT
jgi:hypothetical protein